MSNLYNCNAESNLGRITELSRKLHTYGTTLTLKKYEAEEIQNALQRYEELLRVMYNSNGVFTLSEQHQMDYILQGESRLKEVLRIGSAHESFEKEQAAEKEEQHTQLFAVAIYNKGEYNLDNICETFHLRELAVAFLREEKRKTKNTRDFYEIIEYKLED